MILLGDEDFDVTDVDFSSVEFAGAPVDRVRRGLIDLNRDGFPDVLIYFRIRETNLMPGDDEACLTGMTEGGQRFEACSDICVIGTFRMPKHRFFDCSIFKFRF